MADFIQNGFWVLVGILVGVVGAYVPLAKSISKVKESAVMKEDCEKLSQLRARPTAQAIETMTSEVSEMKAELKEMRKEFARISRYINGRVAQ